MKKMKPRKMSSHSGRTKTDYEECYLLCKGVWILLTQNGKPSRTFEHSRIMVRHVFQEEDSGRDGKWTGGQEEMIKKATTETLNQSYGYKMEMTNRRGVRSQVEKGLVMHGTWGEEGGIRNSSHVK